MYVYVYVCMHACTHVRKYACTHVRKYVMYRYVRMYAYVHMKVCTHVLRYVRTYVWMYTSIDIVSCCISCRNKQTNTQTHKQTNKHEHVNIRWELVDQHWKITQRSCLYMFVVIWVKTLFSSHQNSWQMHVLLPRHDIMGFDPFPTPVVNLGFKSLCPFRLAD